MVIVELLPTAGVTVTQRGGVRNAATVGMVGVSPAHAASMTSTVRSVESAAVTRCGSTGGVRAGGTRATSGAERGRRGRRGEGFPPPPPPPLPSTATGGGPAAATPAKQREREKTSGTEWTRRWR